MIPQSIRKYAKRLSRQSHFIEAQALLRIEWEWMTPLEEVLFHWDEFQRVTTGTMINAFTPLITAFENFSNAVGACIMTDYMSGITNPPEENTKL